MKEHLKLIKLLTDNLQEAMLYASYLSGKAPAGISTLKNFIQVAGHHRASPSVSLDKNIVLNFILSDLILFFRKRFK